LSTDSHASVLPDASQASVGAHLLVDPSAAEAERAERSVIVAMDAPKAALAHIAVSGAFAAAELKDALELAEDVCTFYDGKLREAAAARAAAQAAACAAAAQ
jgi:exosome complex RNA-binding protein Rrp42 (RNase PH superfamily)